MAPKRRPARPQLVNAGDIPHDRGSASFEAFRLLLAETYEVTATDQDAVGEFWFKATSFQLANASLTETSGASVLVDRDRNRIARGNDDILIVLQLQGSALCTADGRSVRLESGDVAILDCARPFTIDMSAFQNLVLAARRDRTPQALRGGASHATVLSRTTGTAELVGAQMKQLFSLVESLALVVVNAGIDAILAVVAGALESSRTGDSAPGDNDNGQLDARRRRALDYIDSSLDNPALSPQRVADHLGLSRSTTYRLFSDEDGLRSMILRRRLDGSLQALLDDEHSRKPLRDIAEAFGFQSEAHFSRSFRSRFGLPPRRFSALAATRDRSRFALQGSHLGSSASDVDAPHGPEKKCA